MNTKKQRVVQPLQDSDATEDLLSKLLRAELSPKPTLDTTKIEAVLKRLSWLVIPIAIPAWILESTYRKISNRFWEFHMASGTLYIISLVIISFAMIVSHYIVLQIISVYILSALELLGILMAGGVVFGRMYNYKPILRRLTRRKSASGNSSKIHVSDVWAAITSYLYTAFYFAIINYFIYTRDKVSYNGVQGRSTYEVLFNFIYSSYVSITTFGYAEILPASVLSKSIYMIEVTLGLLFTLFIFSLIANSIIARRMDQ